VMFCSPDLLGWTAAARELERRWEAEAECEADTRAVMGQGSRAMALASALVKVARLQGSRAQSPSPRWSLSSAFHVPTLLELRVRRLVSGAFVPARGGRARAWSAAAVAIALSAVVWTTPVSHLLHLVTEAMVTHLP
jgi:hypothetical protein